MATFKVYANPVSCQIVDTTQKVKLGEFNADNWGTAFVKAIRLAKKFNPNKYDTDDFFLKVDRGQTLRIVKWGAGHGKHFYDLMSPDNKGYLFRINSRNVNRKNAFDLIWNERSIPRDY